MRRNRTAIALGLVVAALALAGCGGDDDEAAAPDTDTTTTTTTTTVPETGAVLNASVGPGFEISLTTEDGEPVETLAAGSYTLLTDDQADIHNFHLTGEGVDVDTGVSESGTDSFDVTVTEGTYTFVCDPHAGSMNGSFDVSG
jgi:plastocyanin